jgi:hypothetical protein
LYPPSIKFSHFKYKKIDDLIDTIIPDNDYEINTYLDLLRKAAPLSTGSLTSLQSSLILEVSLRNSLRFTTELKYNEFTNVLKTQFINEQTLVEYSLIFKILSDEISESLLEYSVNENMIMRSVLINLKNDEDIDTQNHNMISKNIRLIISNIMISMQRSKNIQKNVLENKNEVNVTKYISFNRFVNKMKELENNDLNDLVIYVDSVRETIFRFNQKFTKTEKDVFAKKFQIVNIVENLHTNVLNGSIVLLCVYIFEQIFSDQFKRRLKNLGTRKGMVDGMESVVNRKNAIFKSISNAKEFSTNVFKGGEAAKNGGEAKTSKIISSAFTIVLFCIFFTFVKSYIMKHKTDLKYNQLVNVLNTIQFEVDFDKYAIALSQYVNTRNVRDLKVLYHSKIKMIEIYEKCNFIKGSIRTTPFPFTEMLTNGTLILIFAVIVYVTFIGTGASTFFESQNELKDIAETIQSKFNDTAFIQRQQNEVKRDIIVLDENELKKLRNGLKKYAVSDSNSEPELKKSIEVLKLDLTSKVIDMIRNDLNNVDFTKTDQIDQNRIIRVFKESFDNRNTKSPLSRIQSLENDLVMIMNEANNVEIAELSKIVDVTNKYKVFVKDILFIDKNTALSVFDRIFITGENVQAGGNTKVEPQKGGDDLRVQQLLLKKMQSVYLSTNSRIEMLKKDTGYVNVTMAVSILLFGTYFCFNIFNNSVNYGNMLQSGGSFNGGGGNCL